MKKLKQIKQAIKNTSPDRLAKIEYQSHFMQMVGVSMVCGILIWKGFWWIIFAFIFSLGVSYSQGVGAYQKYNAIKEIVGDNYNYEKDKSPSRRRDYIIKQVFPEWIWIVVAAASSLIVYFGIPPGAWYMWIARTVFVITFYILIYFFVLYGIAKTIYDRRKEDD